MFYTISNSKFQFLVRLVGSLMLAILVFITQAHADSGDYQPGGRYDFSSPKPLFGEAGPGGKSYSQYDSSGRDFEQRSRDEVFRRQQDYIDAERRRSQGESQGNYGWIPPTVTVMPNGKSITCWPPTKGFQYTVCQ